MKITSCTRHIVPATTLLTLLTTCVFGSALGTSPDAEKAATRQGRRKPRDCTPHDHSTCYCDNGGREMLTPVLEERALKRSRLIFKLQYTSGRSDAF